MGKGKKDGGKKRNRHIPKEVLGFTVPKELRRAGEGLIGAVIDKAQTAEGRQAIAGTLSMAAAALSATVAAERARRQEPGATSQEQAADPVPPPPPPPPPPPSPPPQGTTREPDPQAIADTLGRIAQAALSGWTAGRKGG